jgi:soluble lytic murein transglycosylase-like protein
MLRFFSILMGMFLLCGDVGASCYKEAAARYQVSERLLRAIAKVESSGRNAQTVVNVNTDGSRDIGRMQINSGWLPPLAKFGIGEKELRDECVSITVGAWIVAQNIQNKGLNWDAIGAYNVGCKYLSKAECEKRRNIYAWKVFRAIKPDDKQAVQTVVAQAPAETKRRIGSVQFNVENEASQ